MLSITCRQTDMIDISVYHRFPNTNINYAVVEKLHKLHCKYEYLRNVNRFSLSDL